MQYRQLRRAALTVVVVAVSVIAVLWILESNLLRDAAIARIAKETGRDLVIDGGLDLHPGLRPRISARDVRFGNADWAAGPDMAQIEHLEVEFDLLALARGRWVFHDLRARGASFHLERDKEGRANWQWGSTAGQPGRGLEIRSLVIEDSRITLHDRSRDIELNATLTASGPAGHGQNSRVFALEGAGRFQGEELELEIRGGSLLALRGQEEPYPLEARIRIGETDATLAGTVRAALRAGDMSLKLQIAGPNAALLAPILNLPLPRTRPYVLSGDLVREEHVWRFDDFSGVVGGSDLTGSLSVDVAGERPLMVADLVSERIEFVDLAPAIGLEPGAILSDESDGERPLRILSDAGLQRAQVQRTDAQVMFRGKTFVSPRTEVLKDVEIDLELNNGVLQFTPLQFRFNGGALTLFASIYSDVEPAHSDIDIRLSGMRMQNILDLLRLEGSAEGTLEGRARFSARGDTLRSAMATADGDASLVMEQGLVSGTTVAALDAGFLEALTLVLGDGEPDPMTIHCLVAGFDIENGLMTARTAVLDSEETLIRGEGTIDLGKETLALRIQGRPKKPGIGHTRLAVTISGPFTSPSVDVDPSEILVRGALALGAGALLGPAAAILPFIDLGMSQDSDCLKWIMEAEQQGN
jgi:AsmA family protein